MSSTGDVTGDTSLDRRLARYYVPGSMHSRRGGRISRMGFATLKVVGTLFSATRVYIDTTLLTNVGRIRLGDGKEPRLGDACITGIFGVTPVVTPWGMSVGTTVFNGRRHLGPTCGTTRFSEGTARKSLNLYVEEIRNYILALKAA